MKYLTRIAFLIASVFSSGHLYGQTGFAIDRFLGATPNATTIGTAADNILYPTDLKFSPVPSRKNELWVSNYGDYGSGGYMVLFFDAGKATQVSQFRHDSHAAHFMLQPTAFAMGSIDSEYFATIGEALNSVGDNTSTFMGPVLWDSDTTKFARINQNDWVNGLPLGSHIDMLHQSPYSMGIAFDTLNRYWVFDGYHGCLYHYDFNKSHGYGGDDHSDGKILKYKEVKLKRIANLPSHMIVDKSTGWLYIVDNGNNRIVRVDTRSGHLGNTLIAPDEELLQYAEMSGVKFETVDSGFANLSGIAYLDHRLVVGNSSTGELRVYNTAANPKPAYLGSIATGDAGITGLTIGPDSMIWYVNTQKSNVIRLTPGSSVPLAVTLVSPVDKATRIPVPTTLTWAPAIRATSYRLQLSLRSDFITRIYDSSGITSTSSTLPIAMNFPNLDSSTTYYWRVDGNNTVGEGAWSEGWSFTTIGKKPEKPVLISPIDAAVNVSLNPDLTWNGIKTVQTYEVQVWDSVSDIASAKGLTQPTFSLKNLSPATRYSWKVRGTNDGTDGDWSDTWSFTTLTPASVNENPELASKLQIQDMYPNPSSTISFLSFALREPMHLQVVVFDLLGKEIFVLANENFESGPHTLTINTEALSSGTYYYQFSSSLGVTTKPFIVRK